MIAMVIAWISYFALHSMQASLTVKRWTAARFPNFMPAYRICFNALASIALVPVLWLLYHGERYINYMERVAGLLPLPWKNISNSEACQLASGNGFVN